MTIANPSFDRILSYEQGPGLPIKKLTEWEAILIIRKAYASKKLPVPDNIVALHDFLCVYWAVYEDGKEWTK